MNQKKGGSRLATNSGGEKKKAGRTANQKQKNRRRIIIALAIVLAVLLCLAAAYRMLVRMPEIPTHDKNNGISGENTNQTGEQTVDGDQPYLLSGDRKDGYYTFLICGRDTGGGGNTDTIMLVSYDTVNQQINFMSIPRDTMLNVTWRTKKINSAYNVGGIDGLKDHVAKVTGVMPDFYVLIEWEAVGALVEAIGGVEFDVPYEMNYDDPVQDLHIHVSKGLQKLNGDQAMQVVRWRQNNGNGISIGDSGRMEIQQNFLKAIAKECIQIKNVANVPKLANVFTQYVETDLSVGNLIWFGQTAMLGGITEDSISFCTMPYYSVSYGTPLLSYVLPSVSSLLEIINSDFNPYEEEITSSNLQVLVRNSNGTYSVTSGALADSKMATASSSGGSGGQNTSSTENNSSSGDTNVPAQEPSGSGNGSEANTPSTPSSGGETYNPGGEGTSPETGEEPEENEAVPPDDGGTGDPPEEENNSPGGDENEDDTPYSGFLDDGA